ncbi:MAG: hypothetical protein LUQ12_05695, partial [Methanoregulaceae archaeon]|nr:hypothetical protein [Methanoregulaceae archaeon]
NTTVIMGSVDRQHYGLASSLLATMRNTGMMLSMGIVMIFFALLLGNAPVTPEVSAGFLASMHQVFLVFFVMTIVGAIVSLDRRFSLPAFLRGRAE